jgi:hypothetical protein
LAWSIRVVPPTEVNGYAQAQARKMAAKPLSSLVETEAPDEGRSNPGLDTAHGGRRSKFPVACQPSLLRAKPSEHFMEKRKPDFS